MRNSTAGEPVEVGSPKAFEISPETSSNSAEENPLNTTVDSDSRSSDKDPSKSPGQTAWISSDAVLACCLQYKCVLCVLLVVAALAGGYMHLMRDPSPIAISSAEANRQTHHLEKPVAVSSPTVVHMVHILSDSLQFAFNPVVNSRKVDAIHYHAIYRAEGTKEDTIVHMRDVRVHGYRGWIPNLKTNTTYILSYNAKLNGKWMTPSPTISVRTAAKVRMCNNFKTFKAFDNLVGGKDGLTRSLSAIGKTCGTRNLFPWFTFEDCARGYVVDLYVNAAPFFPMGCIECIIKSMHCSFVNCGISKCMNQTSSKCKRCMDCPGGPGHDQCLATLFECGGLEMQDVPKHLYDLYLEEHNLPAFNCTS
eukprot:162455_1